MHILRVCFFLLSSLTMLRAAGHFTYTPLARKAYDQVLSFRFNEAQLTLARIKLDDPDNLIIHHIENYMDFFRLYISEDKSLYETLKANRDRRLKAVEAGDVRSPYYLYVQAEIRLHWALVRLRFEDYLSAFTEVNRANKLLEKNLELFPDFIATQKDLAILHAMVGTIPEGYQWSIKLLSSLSGTIEQGQKEMEKVVTYAKSHPDFVFAREAQAQQAYLLLHLANQPEAAWKAIRNSDLQPKDNPLHAFVAANIGMRTGHNDEAIDILQACPQGGNFESLPFLEFMLGLAKLRRLDRDAGRHFENYLKKFNGIHYIKETYQKLAWQSLINGDPVAYRKYMLLVSEKGTDTSGGDQNAQREATSGRTPHVDLVRARLLFDGGYLQKAYNLIAGLQLDQSPDIYLRLEYAYRIGRILQGMERHVEALAYLHKVIQEGEDQPYFFACNASLQCGLIYEQRGDWALARQFFKKCLVLNPDEYATGLHQRAKAGLSRIKSEK